MELNCTAFVLVKFLGKFYCVQHHGLQRSAAKSSGQAISALSRDLSSTKYAVLPPKIPSITG